MPLRHAPKIGANSSNKFWQSRHKGIFRAIIKTWTLVKIGSYAAVAAQTSYWRKCRRLSWLTSSASATTCTSSQACSAAVMAVASTKWCACSPPRATSSSTASKARANRTSASPSKASSNGPRDRRGLTRRQPSYRERAQPRFSACLATLPILGASLVISQNSDALSAARSARAGLTGVSSKESQNGDRYREVLQQPEGFWIHPARRWLEGRVRAHQRSRARRHAHVDGRPEGQLRSHHRARQAGGGQSLARVTLPRTVLHRRPARRLRAFCYSRPRLPPDQHHTGGCGGEADQRDRL